MARFMDIHHGLQGLTAEQLQQTHREDVAIQQEEGVTFIRAWGDPDSGKVFCLAEGPNIDAVKRVHQRSGHPADEVYPVPLEVE